MYKKLYNASLLHRILDKASNYKIGHVDTSLKDLRSWFQYSISDRNMDVARAIELSRATIRNIKQDLFWALFYNGIGIPLAAGVFFPLTGWQLSPMFGAAAMSLSSVCVVSNALRLKSFKPKVAK